MRLYELADVIRSKNAGPFTLTIDILLATQEAFDRLLACPDFSPEGVGRRYSVAATEVTIHRYPAACAVKVTMPRPWGGAGEPGDRDVYGSQQHFPLAELDIP